MCVRLCTPPPCSPFHCCSRSPRCPSHCGRDAKGLERTDGRWSCFSHTLERGANEPSLVSVTTCVLCSMRCAIPPEGAAEDDRVASHDPLAGLQGGRGRVRCWSCFPEERESSQQWMRRLNMRRVCRSNQRGLSLRRVRRPGNSRDVLFSGFSVQPALFSHHVCPRPCSCRCSCACGSRGAASHGFWILSFRVTDGDHHCDAN